MGLKPAFTGVKNSATAKTKSEPGNQANQSATTFTQIKTPATQATQSKPETNGTVPPNQAPPKAQAQASQAQTKTPSVNQPQTDHTQSQNQVSPDQLAAKLPQAIQEELIVDWVAPSRPHKARSRQFFSTMWAIALLVAIILVFANQVVFAMVVGALAFMAHLLFKIPPGNIYYALTTFGVRVGEELYFWEELNHYWFDTKYGQRVLMIDTIRFPHRLVLVIFPEDEEILRRLLSTVLPEFKPKPTLYEKWANWLSKTFPLEEEKSTQTKVENHKPSPSKVDKTTSQQSPKNPKSSQK